MMDLSLAITIPDFEKYDRQFIMGQLHAHADDIAEEIETRIEDRTPEDTGALKEDETYTVSGSATELVMWYVGTGYQEAENHRYYAPYQEGPPLGLSTYTNAPHQMYFRATTDDLPIIKEWAQAVVDDAVEQTTQAANDAATQEFFP